MPQSRRTQEGELPSQPPSRSPSKASDSNLDRAEGALTGFPLRLKVLKEQLSSESHPIRILLNEFQGAFVYTNRHLLYTEQLNEVDNFINKAEAEESSKELRKSKASQQRPVSGPITESTRLLGPNGLFEDTKDFNQGAMHDSYENGRVGVGLK